MVLIPCSWFCGLNMISKAKLSWGNLNLVYFGRLNSVFATTFAFCLLTIGLSCRRLVFPWLKARPPCVLAFLLPASIHWHPVPATVQFAEWMASGLNDPAYLHLWSIGGYWRTMHDHRPSLAFSLSIEILSPCDVIFFSADSYFNLLPYLPSGMPS